MPSKTASKKRRAAFAKVGLRLQLHRLLEWSSSAPPSLASVVVLAHCLWSRSPSFGSSSSRAKSDPHLAPKRTPRCCSRSILSRVLRTALPSGNPRALVDGPRECPWWRCRSWHACHLLAPDVVDTRALRSLRMQSFASSHTAYTDRPINGVGLDCAARLGEAGKLGGYFLCRGMFQLSTFSGSSQMQSDGMAIEDLVISTSGSAKGYQTSPCRLPRQFESRPKAMSRQCASSLISGRET